MTYIRPSASTGPLSNPSYAYDDRLDLSCSGILDASTQEFTFSSYTLSSSYATFRLKFHYQLSNFSNDKLEILVKTNTKTVTYLALSTPTNGIYTGIVNLSYADFSTSNLNELKLSFRGAKTSGSDSAITSIKNIWFWTGELLVEAKPNNYSSPNYFYDFANLTDSSYSTYAYKNYTGSAAHTTTLTFAAKEVTEFGLEIVVMSDKGYSYQDDIINIRNIATGQIIQAYGCIDVWCNDEIYIKLSVPSSLSITNLNNLAIDIVQQQGNGTVGQFNIYDVNAIYTEATVYSTTILPDTLTSTISLLSSIIFYSEIQELDPLNDSSGIHLWTFDNNLQDAGGSNLTANNAKWSYSSGLYDDCIFNDYAIQAAYGSLDYDTALLNYANFTVTAQVYFTAGGQGYAYIQLSSINTTRFNIDVTPTARIYINGTNHSVTPTSINTSGWNFLRFERISNDNWKLVINEQEEFYYPNEPVTVLNKIQFYFRDAKIDQVRIFNKLLTTAEIANVRNESYLAIQNITITPDVLSLVIQSYDIIPVLIIPDSLEMVISVPTVEIPPSGINRLDFFNNGSGLHLWTFDQVVSDLGNSVEATTGAATFVTGRFNSGAKITSNYVYTFNDLTASTVTATIWVKPDIGATGNILNITGANEADTVRLYRASNSEVTLYARNTSKICFNLPADVWSCLQILQFIGSSNSYTYVYRNGVYLTNIYNASVTTALPNKITFESNNIAIDQCRILNGTNPVDGDSFIVTEELGVFPYVITTPTPLSLFIELPTATVFAKELFLAQCSIQTGSYLQINATVIDAILGKCEINSTTFLTSLGKFDMPNSIILHNISSFKVYQSIEYRLWGRRILQSLIRSYSQVSFTGTFYEISYERQGVFKITNTSTLTCYYRILKEQKAIIGITSSNNLVIKGSKFNCKGKVSIVNTTSIFIPYKTYTAMQIILDYLEEQIPLLYTAPPQFIVGDFLLPEDIIPFLNREQANV